jgi:hypothetical protein
MEATRKFIQTVRFILAGAVVIYALLVWWLPSSATPNPIILRVITGVCVLEVVVVFVRRRVRLSPVEAILANQPEDAKALARLRQGYVVTYAISLSIALYGLVLHFLGFSMSQVAPFFLVGFVLILFFRPKCFRMMNFRRSRVH